MHECDLTENGPDRPSVWHGIDPRDEVARIRNWWTTCDGPDYLVEDSMRVLAADATGQITWDPHAQRYVIGDVDEARLDEAIRNSR